MIVVLTSRILRFTWCFDSFVILSYCLFHIGFTESTSLAAMTEYNPWREYLYFWTSADCIEISAKNFAYLFDRLNDMINLLFIYASHKWIQYCLHICMIYFHFSLLYRLDRHQIRLNNLGFILWSVMEWQPWGPTLTLSKVHVHIWQWHPMCNYLLLAIFLKSLIKGILSSSSMYLEARSKPVMAQSNLSFSIISCFLLCSSFSM